MNTKRPKLRDSKESRNILSRCLAAWAILFSCMGFLILQGTSIHTWPCMNSLTRTHIELFLCVCMCTGTNVCTHAGAHGCMDALVCTWGWRPEINLRGCSSASIYFVFWEVALPVSTWDLPVSVPPALGVQEYATISFFKTNKQTNMAMETQHRSLGCQQTLYRQTYLLSPLHPHFFT